MKFQKAMVVIAWTMFAVNAHAAETGAEAKTVQDQKTTVTTTVTDTASVKSQASAPTSSESTDLKVDAIKKARQEAEQKNDAKIVEKLEKTRLADEKELSEKIDSTDLKSDDKKQDVAPVAPIVKVEKVEVIQPAPAVPVKEEKEEKKSEDVKKWYAGAGIGNVIYNGNITTKSNFGVVVGNQIDEHLAIEGSLNYASFNLNNFWGGNYSNALFGSMDQYDLGVAVKYNVIDSGRFRPYVGGSVDYLYRQYKDRYPYGFWSYDNYTTSQTTNAVNAGLVGGIDIKIANNFLVGGEFKYSLPIYQQANGLITQSYVMAYAKPLEESSFTSWLLSLKFLF